MPERTYDNNFTTIYRGAEAIQDRRNHPAMVPAGAYPRLTGVDGRYAGSFRRFPGFDEVVSLRDIDVSAAGDTALIGNVYFMKHITVQAVPKFTGGATLSPVSGASSVTLRGFVVAHDYIDTFDSAYSAENNTPVRGVLRFVFYMNDTWFSWSLLQETDFDGQITQRASSGGGALTAVGGNPVYQVNLAAGDAAAEGALTDSWIKMTSGDANGQIRRIMYNKGGSGLEANVYPAFGDRRYASPQTGVPAASDTYTLYPDKASASLIDRSDRYMADTQHADFSSYAGGLIAGAEIDAAAMGPALYWTLNSGTKVKGDTNGIAQSPLEGEAPRDHYRKSVRFMTKTANPTSLDDLEVLVTDLGPLKAPPYWTNDTETNKHGATGGQMPAGTVRVGARTFTPYKNVEGPLYAVDDVTVTGSNSDEKVIIPSPDSDDYDSSNYWYDLEKAGLDDRLMAPRVRLYRSINSGYFSSILVDGGVTAVGGTLFRENEVGLQTWGTQELVDYNVTQIFSAFADTGDTTHHDLWFDEGSSHELMVGNVRLYQFDIGISPEAVLASGARINRFRDDTAEAPEFVRLLMPYQGTLLRVGGQPQGAPPHVTLNRDNVLSWGSLTKYAPEQFRVADSTPLGGAYDEKLLSLVAAGDFAFVVGDSGIFRVHRSGSLLGINEIQTLTGGVGRYAALGVGTTLYYVAPNGVYAVDGPTGEFQSLSAMDRIVNEDWRESLGAVRMAYDNRLGAVMFLNDTEDEMVLLWSNTGVVSNLKDVPFLFGTQGVNPADAGFSRSFWVTSKGSIVSPNAERSSGVAQTMCGGDSTLTWNTTVQEIPTNVSPKQVIVGVTPEGNAAPYDQALVGYKLHWLSGTNEGSSYTIDTVALDGIVLAEEMTYAPEVGDRFSLAPIIFEVIGWPVQDPQDGLDPFNSKVVTGMAHSIIIKGGGGGGPNDYMEHRLHRRGDLDTAPVSAEAGMDADTSKNYSRVNLRAPILYPGWRQRASDHDFELLGGIVHAKMTSSEAETDPAG